jgi:hypothetical protein
MNRPPADGAVNDDLLQFAFEVGLHRQQFGAREIGPHRAHSIRASPA